jgi:hypothetical protein
MNTIEEKRIGKYLIKILPDDTGDNPRNWDNIGTMICFHKRYDLGDKHDYDHNDYDNWSEMEAAIIKKEKAAIILPLYLYDHGGITINTTGFSCPWDSGRLGFIFVSKKKVLAEYGGKRITPDLIEKATKYLIGEVETYDQYLRGDVYGYQVFKVDECDMDDEEELDACWGYYGQDECMKEAEATVEWHLEDDKKKAEKESIV